MRSKLTFVSSLSLTHILLLVLSSSTCISTISSAVAAVAAPLEAHADSPTFEQVSFSDEVRRPKASERKDSGFSSKTATSSSTWTLPCSLVNGGNTKSGGRIRSCYNGRLPIREEHRVGDLPWAEGEEPIEESYAGHFPIRSWNGSGYHGETSMYYWFFPAIKPKVKDPPLIIWLQGGPGSSSMIGLFFENGPIRVTEDMKLARQSVSWADDYTMLFIDQPVGTGFSYVTRRSDEDDQLVKDKPTLKRLSEQLHSQLLRDQAREQQVFANHIDREKPFQQEANRMHKTAILENKDPMFYNGYVKDQRAVVQDLLVFLDQFYERYPEQQSRDLYLAGESYAGKYIPALAYGIIESNKGRRHRHVQDQVVSVPEQIHFPLKGIALGNSLTDPVSQVQIHADHAFYLGLVTKRQAERMRSLQQSSVEEAKQGRFFASNERRLEVFEAFKNATGGLNWYDIRKGSVSNDWSRMEKFLNLASVKDSLNVFGPRKSFLESQGVPSQEIERIEQGREETEYTKDPIVIKSMGGDIMKSAAWMVSELLKHEDEIKVLAYQGVFDFRDAVAGSQTWIDELEWSGQEAFLDTERELWLHNGQLAGYITRTGKLAKVVVLGAGHLAPMDQPKSNLEMIKSLIEGYENLQLEKLGERSRRSAPAHII
ncbi:hypothetical protein BGZ83_002928 [Gryganskiella cystojenkinii]|nr:hypothetical protein BGZ83_002928 [Gryganskiella cystojenkinii]